MESTAQINGHPIHPMLIPYPFALLSSGTAFEVAAQLTGRRELSQTARHVTTAGIGAAIAAAIPGIIDYFGSVSPHTSARASATKHALCNLSALACFTLAESRRDGNESLPTTGLVFALAGTALLSAGGWLGGELVYHEHVGVPGIPPAMPTSRALFPPAPL